MSLTVGTNPATNYVWDVNRGVPVVLQDGANTYVYGLGLISVTDRSGNQTYYTSDGLGSTTDLTNTANPPVRTDGYTYDAFGAPTHTLGASANNFQFTGQQRDPNSGLDYLRARYYDPGIGRFLTRDPMPGRPTVPQTWDQYPYASNNPTSRVDPTGMSPELMGIPLSCFGLAFNVIAAFIVLGPLFGPWSPLVGLPFLFGQLFISAGTGNLPATFINIGGQFGSTLTAVPKAPAIANFGGALLLINLAYSAAECSQDVVPR